ncbi:glycerol kinase [Hesseltinella vesiculosa]|uniref:Probable glycerol kinase n=1 Tax=Hesseltinella vesiculosa TaxID=101127 RepID=A0A1X2GK21_9FUNG|nr:glycerol kinase [Hesseltinella vesiculosa]
MPNTYIGAIDQGTTSTRFLLFNDKGRLVTSHQLEFPQKTPCPGWLEHDPYDLLDTVIRCADEALRKFGMMGRTFEHIKGIGITNQRETTLVWDRKTGEPLYNAIVWGDTRTDRIVERLKTRDNGGHIEKLCGLPIHNYFSALKLNWLIENVPKVKEAIDQDRAAFGTVDTWLLWNLTGGIQGGLHITDVTNASRTMLMNLQTCQWDDQLLEFFGVPRSILPAIVSSSEIYGKVRWGPMEGLPLAGCLGDQQAALVGQRCFEPGEAKNTYGTGAFLVMNVGETAVHSNNGLLATPVYKFGNQPTVYGLEGSTGVAGAAVRWLQHNLGIISKPTDMDDLANQVEDTGGVVFVPAFSGLFAPYWRDDARGTLVGLTQFSNRCHIARATLESVCFATHGIISAMKDDSHIQLKTLRVDGGLSSSDTCMQIQADLLGIPVERPKMRETTGLGVAFAAGLAVGVWSSTDEIRDLEENTLMDVFSSTLNDHDRALKLKLWNAAIERSYGWAKLLE